MIQKRLAVVAALLLLLPLPAEVVGQSNQTPASPSVPARSGSRVGTSNPTVPLNQLPPAVPPPATTPVPGSQPFNPNAAGGNPTTAAPSGSSTDCVGGNCDLQPAHISIATPAPAPAPWPWQARIAWGANILLVVLAYVAIMMALSLLRKIDRQTQYAEQAAEAARESAKAALATAQAMERAERPWVIVNVRPAPNVENGFALHATNRGRGPARLVSMVDEVVSAVDESQLSPAPVYKNNPLAPSEPVILLPGESTEILSFSRADVQRICETEERLKRVEKWEEKIFLYGKVIYRDLAASDNEPAHESSWFCWYIHGQQKSGMVMAGPLAYNRHT